MIKVLAIDDEPLALQQLAAYIRKVPTLELVGQCQSALEARDILNREQVDALFCDINMPDLNGMDFIKSGFLASVPFLAAFIGVLCSGVLSDFLIRHGATVGLARKLPIILGLLISTSMIGANFTDSTPWVIFFLALAFFGNGLASITWSLVSALAPVRLLGLTGGVFNFVGNLSSICTPIVIGFLVSKDSFAPAIVYVSSLALLGALSYILLVGKVERIEA